MRLSATATSTATASQRGVHVWWIEEDYKENATPENGDDRAGNELHRNTIRNKVTTNNKFEGRAGSPKLNLDAEIGRIGDQHRGASHWAWAVSRNHGDCLGHHDLSLKKGISKFEKGHFKV